VNIKLKDIEISHEIWCDYNTRVNARLAATRQELRAKVPPPECQDHPFEVGLFLEILVAPQEIEKWILREVQIYSVLDTLNTFRAWGHRNFILVPVFDVIRPSIARPITYPFTKSPVLDVPTKNVETMLMNTVLNILVSFLYNCI
jgi:hypothetical protein